MESAKEGFLSLIPYDAREDDSTHTEALQIAIRPDEHLEEYVEETDSVVQESVVDKTERQLVGTLTSQESSSTVLIGINTETNANQQIRLHSAKRRLSKFKEKNDTEKSEKFNSLNFELAAKGLTSRNTSDMAVRRTVPQLGVYEQQREDQVDSVETQVVIEFSQTVSRMSPSKSKTQEEKYESSEESGEVKSSFLKDGEFSKKNNYSVEGQLDIVTDPYSDKVSTQLKEIEDRQSFTSSSESQEAEAPTRKQTGTVTYIAPEHVTFSMENRLVALMNECMDPMKLQCSQMAQQILESKVEQARFATTFNEQSLENKRANNVRNDIEILYRQNAAVAKSVIEVRGEVQEKVKGVEYSMEKMAANHRLLKTEIDHLNRYYDIKDEDRVKYQELLDNFKTRISEKFKSLNEEYIQEVYDLRKRVDKLQQLVSQTENTCFSVKERVQLNDIVLKKQQVQITHLFDENDRLRLSFAWQDKFEKLQIEVQNNQGIIDEAFKTFSNKFATFITKEDAYRLSFNLQVDMARSIFNWETHASEWQKKTLCGEKFEKFKALDDLKAQFKHFSLDSSHLLHEAEPKLPSKMFKQKWKDFEVFQNEFKKTCNPKQGFELPALTNLLKWQLKLNNIGATQCSKHFARKQEVIDAEIEAEKKRLIPTPPAKKDMSSLKRSFFKSNQSSSLDQFSDSLFQQQKLKQPSIVFDLNAMKQILAQPVDQNPQVLLANLRRIQLNSKPEKTLRRNSLDLGQLNTYLKMTLPRKKTRAKPKTLLSRSMIHLFASPPPMKSEVFSFREFTTPQRQMEKSKVGTPVKALRNDSAPNLYPNFLAPPLNRGYLVSGPELEMDLMEVQNTYRKIKNQMVNKDPQDSKHFLLRQTSWVAKHEKRSIEELSKRKTQMQEIEVVTRQIKLLLDQRSETRLSDRKSSYSRKRTDLIKLRSDDKTGRRDTRASRLKFARNNSLSMNMQESSNASLSYFAQQIHSPCAEPVVLKVSAKQSKFRPNIDDNQDSSEESQSDEETQQKCLSASSISKRSSNSKQELKVEDFNTPLKFSNETSDQAFFNKDFSEMKQSENSVNSATLSLKKEQEKSNQLQILKEETDQAEKIEEPVPRRSETILQAVVQKTSESSAGFREARRKALEARQAQSRVLMKKLDSSDSFSSGDSDAARKKYVKQLVPWSALDDYVTCDMLDQYLDDLEDHQAILLKQKEEEITVWFQKSIKSEVEALEERLKIQQAQSQETVKNETFAKIEAERQYSHEARKEMSDTLLPKLVQETRESLRDLFTELQTEMMNRADGLLNRVDEIQQFTTNFESKLNFTFQKFSRLLSDTKLFRDELSLQMQQNVELMAAQKEDYNGLAHIIAVLVELQFISQSLEFQDENDKHNLQLFGLDSVGISMKDLINSSLPVSEIIQRRLKADLQEQKEGKVINQTLPPLKKGEKNIDLVGNLAIQISDECLNCGDDRLKSTLMQAYKMACLNYTPSKIVYRRQKYERKALIEAKRMLLDMEWEKTMHSDSFISVYGTKGTFSEMYYRTFQQKLDIIFEEIAAKNPNLKPQLTLPQELMYEQDEQTKIQISVIEIDPQKKSMHAKTGALVENDLNPNLTLRNVQKNLLPQLKSHRNDREDSKSSFIETQQEAKKKIVLRKAHGESFAGDTNATTRDHHFKAFERTQLSPSETHKALKKSLMHGDSEFSRPYLLSLSRSNLETHRRQMSVADIAQPFSAKSNKKMKIGMFANALSSRNNSTAALQSEDSVKMCVKPFESNSQKSAEMNSDLKSMTQALRQVAGQKKKMKVIPTGAFAQGYRNARLSADIGNGPLLDMRSLVGKTRGEPVKVDCDEDSKGQSLFINQQSLLGSSVEPEITPNYRRKSYASKNPDTKKESGSLLNEFCLEPRMNSNSCQ